MISLLGHLIGFAGMLCVVLAFYKTVHGTWSSQSLKYNQVNLAGAILLIISLFIHFNLGSFIIEVFWIMISLKGIYNAKRKESDCG